MKEASVYYVNIGGELNPYSVKIWTYPNQFGGIEDPTTVFITVKKSYRYAGEEGVRAVVGEYSIDKKDGSYTFHGKKPLPADPERKLHAWSREP